MRFYSNDADPHLSTGSGVILGHMKANERWTSSMVTKIATMLPSSAVVCQGTTLWWPVVLVKPPPTPSPTLFATPPVIAEPLPNETAPLVELL